MSTPTLKFIPNLEDLVSAGVAGAIASFNNQSPSTKAVEQLASGLAADNIAAYSAMTDGMMSETALSVPIKESDVLAGAVRAGYGMWQGRSNRAILMDGVAGVASKLIGRELRKALFGEPTTTTTTTA